MKKAIVLVSTVFIFIFHKKGFPSQSTICLTGKIESFLPTYKASFVNSVNLALSQNPLSKNIVVKSYFYDNNFLSPVRAYNQMIDDHCSVIIGFEYLNDLMLIYNTQKDTKIPIFTSYSSSLESDHFARNIFMPMPSYDYHAKKMIDFLYKKFTKISDVLIVTEVNRLDLVKYKSAYADRLKAKKVPYDSFDFLENDKKMEIKLENFILRKNYKFVFVLSGAVGSTKVVNKMNNRVIKFIGTENFGSSNYQSLYVRLKDKKVNAFLIRNIDYLKMNELQSNFINDYFNRYRILPVQIGMYSYDAVKIILDSLKNNTFISVDNILKIKFHGITGCSINNGKFHRSDYYTILSITEKGFSIEE